MGYIGSNIMAILVATLAGLAIGAVFLRLGGPEPAGRSRTAFGTIVVALLAEFWLAAILAGALILAPTTTQAGAWTMAIASAVVIWVGFVLPTLVVSYLRRGLAPGVVALDSAHWLIVMVGQAIVFQAIGLIRP